MRVCVRVCLVVFVMAHLRDASLDGQSDADK